MRFGAVFPQREIRESPQQIVDYASGVEALGFEHILAYDHVLGADPAQHPGWSKYTNRDPFHEPLVMFGFLAANCGLELVSGVIVLPQRQTALVAKQAAQVDWLSNGRLRLGVGLGWNALEYEALNEDFPSRSRRVEEQIALMRALWSSSSVTMNGEHHTVNGMGIAPMPTRPIPVWIGARADGSALGRVGRVADGWMPLGTPGSLMSEALDKVRHAAVAAGRKPEELGVEARVEYGDGSLDRIGDEVGYWKRCRATHISFSTMDSGLACVDAHLEALQKVLEAVKSV